MAIRVVACKFEVRQRQCVDASMLRGGYDHDRNVSKPLQS